MSASKMENDKLIRLSHAISAAKTGADDWDGGCNIERDRYIEKAFADLPAVDAVEVRRCKDCWAYRTDNELAKAEYLNPDEYCVLMRCEFPPDGYCSYGRCRGEKHNAKAD